MNLVITGSSSGIGRALAERLLARGHLVWGLARSDQTGLTTSHPGKFHASACDVSDWKQISRVAAEITSAWPHVDGLITCAACHGAIGRTTRIDPASWSSALRTNLDGTFHAIRVFDDSLARAPRRAKIVCFSGGGATKPRANFSAYGAAKAAVVRLVETIADEERGRALDINAIAPGIVATRLTDEIVHLGPSIVGDAEFAAASQAKAANGPSLEHALGLVEWLLSPDSDGISGKLLSAKWDPWRTLARHRGELATSDIYTLRRIVPGDRGQAWD